jgi:hypothetical protein
MSGDWGASLLLGQPLESKLRVEPTCLGHGRLRMIVVPQQASAAAKEL